MLRRKFYKNILGHITKMASRPIYGKNLNKNVLWNQEPDDLENWYTATGTEVLPNLLK